jgi:hypothetical protein
MTDPLCYGCAMHKLLYVSSTKRDFPDSDLETILVKSRNKNLALGITGLLLYVDGGFLQVLEGEKDVIVQLYTTIARDPRHWDAKLLLDNVSPRNFGAWSMGFKALKDEAGDAGLVEITQAAIGGLIQPGGAQPLLQVLLRTFCTVQGASHF